MQAFLTTAGLTLLQNELAVLSDPPTLTMSGFQVGSAAGFVPTDTMTQAQGTILVDRHLDKNSIKLTPIHQHEIIVTAILDRGVELLTVGHVLFFAQNTPFLWLIADQAFGKLGTSSISHFAGDACYMPVVFRFPYISKILALNPAALLTAHWPIFIDMTALKVAPHTLCSQCVVENNNLYFGRGHPNILARYENGWRSTPLMRRVDKDFYQINGGTNILGQ